MSSIAKGTQLGAFKRDPRWRQGTPRLQIVACVAGAQGDLSNLQEGIAPDPAVSMARMEKALGDVQSILRYCPNLESWPEAARSE